MANTDPQAFEVLLTEGAEQDLKDLHHYIAERDGVVQADGVLDRLSDVLEGLARFPERGAIQKNFWRRASRSTGKPPSNLTE